MSSKLEDITLKLLENCPRTITYSQIAKDTGLKKAWISAFARKSTGDPGIRKVQKLHDYLTSIEVKA